MHVSRLSTRRIFRPGSSPSGPRPNSNPWESLLSHKSSYMSESHVQPCAAAALVVDLSGVSGRSLVAECLLVTTDLLAIVLVAVVVASPYAAVGLPAVACLVALVGFAGKLASSHGAGLRIAVGHRTADEGSEAVDGPLWAHTLLMTHNPCRVDADWLYIYACSYQGK